MNFDKAQARVEFDTKRTDVYAMCTAILALGYECSLKSTDSTQP